MRFTRFSFILIFIFAMTTARLVFPAPSRAEVVDRVVAIINDSVITLSELNAATAVAVDKLGLDAKDSKKALEIKNKVLESLIEQKLVKQASDKAGIEVSEREIDNAVEDVKRQNDLTQERLMLALAQSGLTYKEYREQMKEQIRQVKFMNKEFRSKISIPEEDVLDYYTANKSEFFGPALYRINMIFIPAGGEAMKKKIRIVEEGLKKGGDFRDLASHYSEGPTASMGGDMGYLKAGEMSKAIEDEVKKLKVNGISPAIETPEGTYFVQLIDVKEAEPLSLSEVKPEIYERIYKRIMDERFDFWISEVKKFAHIEIRL